LVHFVLLDNK